MKTEYIYSYFYRDKLLLTPDFHCHIYLVTWSLAVTPGLSPDIPLGHAAQPPPMPDQALQDECLQHNLRYLYSLQT